MNFITLILQFLGFGAKIASENQTIVNAPDVVKAKEAGQDLKDEDASRKAVQTGDTATLRDDFSH